MKSSLYEALSVEQIASGELEQVLGSHFRGARQADVNEVKYPGEDDNFAVRVIYDGARIIDIIPGPLLTDLDVQGLVTKIQDELLGAADEVIAENVFFASVPTTGWFQYRDRFQIAPVPDGAPQTQFLGGDHPFILRYAHKTSPNIGIMFGRRYAAERDIELLLATVVPYQLHSQTNRQRHQWVNIPSDDYRSSRTFYAQQGYRCPDLSGARSGFPPPKSPALNMTPATDYYSHSGVGPAQTLELPESMTHLCDQFFRLQGRNRERFLTAAYWLHHAELIQVLSRSAYFIALISAVDALLPQPDRRSPCELCGHVSTKGQRARFSEFVERFAGKAISHSERTALYGVRSALAHGGKLLRSDIVHPIAGGLTQDTWLEIRDLGLAASIVRNVLVNWLATLSTDDMQQPQNDPRESEQDR